MCYKILWLNELCCDKEWSYLYKNLSHTHIQIYVEQVAKCRIESGAKHRLCTGAKRRGAKWRAPMQYNYKLECTV